MNFNAFFKSLGLKTPDKCFEGTFLSALEEYRKDGVFFLNVEYIDYVNSFESCILNCIDDVKRAAKKILEEENLAFYALFLYRAMQKRESFMEHISEFEFPEGEKPEYDLLPFLVIITAIPELYSNLKKRGVPDDIISATLRQFEDCAYLTEERTGKLGYLKRYFDHMQLYVDEKILNIGRLRFQMIEEFESNVSVLKNTDGELTVLFDGAEINSVGRLYGTPPDGDNEKSFRAAVVETEESFIGYRADQNGNCTSEPSEYPKNKWCRVLKKGNPILSVHIPNKGALTKEACEESYMRAREVFKSCYPEFRYKAFHCHSWMLDPELREFLPENSNILEFQGKYTLYPGETEGIDVFNFVFKMQYTKETDYQSIPEETSLQRALKNHYLAGKYIYEYEGIFK